MPELTLYAADNNEPVTWRVARLARVAEHAGKLALTQSVTWGDALLQLSDVEGELTAVWKDESSQMRFSFYIEEAWRNVGENAAVCHEVLER